MGDYAELVIEGILCELCGGVVEIEDGVLVASGYPRKCTGCLNDEGSLDE